MLSLRFFFSLNKKTEKLSTNFRGYYARICGFYFHSPLIGINNVISSNRNEREMKQQQCGFGQQFINRKWNVRVHGGKQTPSKIIPKRSIIKIQQNSIIAGQHVRNTCYPPCSLCRLFILPIWFFFGYAIPNKTCSSLFRSFYCLHLCGWLLSMRLKHFF